MHTYFKLVRTKLLEVHNELLGTEYPYKQFPTNIILILVRTKLLKDKFPTNFKILGTKVRNDKFQTNFKLL